MLVNQSEETEVTNNSDTVNLVDEIMKLDPACAKQMGVYKFYKKELGEDFKDPTLSELPTSQ